MRAEFLALVLCASACGATSALREPARSDVVDATDATDATDVVDVVDVMDIVDVRDVFDASDVTDVVTCSPYPPAASCAELHARCPLLPSGAYPLRSAPLPMSTAPTDWTTWCEMTADGGGWSLILKADGRFATFAFDALQWSDSSVMNERSSDLTEVEAKFAGFSVLPFTAMRVGIATIGSDASVQWLVVNSVQTSLLAAMQSGYVPLSAGRDAWLALVPGADLQANCNREGLSARGMDMNQSRVRIGVIANQENDCNTPDSFIGIGGSDYRTATTSGAYCDSQWTCAHGASVDLARFGYVLVR